MSIIRILTIFTVALGAGLAVSMSSSCTSTPQFDSKGEVAIDSDQFVEFSTIISKRNAPIAIQIYGDYERDLTNLPVAEVRLAARIQSPKFVLSRTSEGGYELVSENKNNQRQWVLGVGESSQWDDFYETVVGRIDSEIIDMQAVIDAHQAGTVNSIVVIFRKLN